MYNMLKEHAMFQYCTTINTAQEAAAVPYNNKH